MNPASTVDRSRYRPGCGWTKGLGAILARVHFVCVLGCGVGAWRDSEGGDLIRFCFARSMFGGVSENDARAAMKVYAESLGDPSHDFVIADPYLFAGTKAIGEALTSRSAEMFALTTPEFVSLEPLGLAGPILVSQVKETVTEEYVLLARSDGEISGPAALKSRTLALSGDVRSCMATIWLEVVFRELGMGSPERVLSRMSTVSKPSQALLPVYFGKTDACLVTRTSWDVMCELNPQIRHKLRLIANSPPMVPALTCFRGDLSEETKRRVVEIVHESFTRPAYRQMMQLFKADKVGPQPMSVLDGTRELLARHRRLRESSEAAGTSDDSEGGEESR